MMTSCQVHPVPRGWRRVVTVDAVYYVSPDKRVLWNRTDVLKHLTSWGTCKCGLQCPIDIDILFSFNRDVPTGHELPSPTGSCAHVRNHDTSINLTAAETLDSDKVTSCDAQEIKSVTDESHHEVDGGYIEDPDGIITQDLDKSDPPGAIVSLFETPFHDSETPFHEPDQLVSLNVQEKDKSNSDNNTVKNTELLSNKDIQVTGWPDTTEVNKSLLNTSTLEAQVFNINRINVEDNLLTAADSQANPKVLCTAQEERPGSSDLLGNGVESNLPATEKPPLSPNNSPVSKLYKQQELQKSPVLLRKPISPQNNSPVSKLYKQQELQESPVLLQKPMSPQRSPSPLNSSQLSLSSCDVDERLAMCKTIPQVRLVDQDYDADADSVDEDATDCNVLPSGTEIKPPVGDYKFTDDSTDSISYDSDSNSLVHEKCGIVTVSKTDSIYLTHNLSDTGTASDEVMELCTDMKLPSTELLSPPLSCMKTVVHKSNYTSISSMVSKDDMVPSVMDVCISTERNAKVHTVETPPLFVSTVSTTNVTPSLLKVPTPHIFSPSTSPIFDLSSESVCPISDATSLGTMVSTVSSASSDTSPAISYKCTHSDSIQSLMPPTTFIPSFCNSGFVSYRDTPVSGLTSPAHTTDSCKNNDIQSPVNIATGFLISQSLKTVTHSMAAPVSITCSEVSVFATPRSILNTCSSPIPELQTSIPASDSIPSTSILASASQVCNSPMNDDNSQAIAMTQASSEMEAVHSADKNITTVTSTVTSNGNGDHDIKSAQLLDCCQTDKEVSSVPDTAVNDDDDDGPVTTFPAALTLSIDLSVLPQKKKVLQRAKWAALLTTPVPILRERKKSIRPTVTVKSTVIKSDRTATTKGIPIPIPIPKKQQKMPANADQHKVGDVVWSKFSYWDLWPCKIILHSDVDQPIPTPDQVKTLMMSAIVKGMVWVEWFGDHSYSKVDRSSLKSYEEGLQLHLSSKKRKHTRKLKRAVTEVRNEVEGISTVTKGSTKKKKQLNEVQKDRTSVDKEGCP